MCADTQVIRSSGAPLALRKRLWNGVLPEALGLCFVLIVLGGFVAAYLIATATWRQRAAECAQQQAEALAHVVAATAGQLADGRDEDLAALLKELTAQANIRALRWVTPDGLVRFEWPPQLGVATAGADGLAITAAAAPVATPAGEPAGTLRLELRAAGHSSEATLPIWPWAIAAGVGLLAFTAVYARLRRHLRPVQAIERSLTAYAQGLEEELNALALSDSFGSVARGWNLLIEQLGDARRQLENVAGADNADEVLARFEGSLFRRMLDQAPFGLMCVNVDRRVSYMNSAAAALLGRAPEAVLGRPFAESVDDPTVAQAVVGNTLRSATERAIDYLRRAADSEVFLRLRPVPLAGQAGDGDTLVTVEDIGQLRADQRARDNFLYHVTHELRTPLTSIHAYAETLTRPGFDDEQTRKECYNVIISETRRLANLVDNILNVSQLEVGTARLDLGEVDLVRLMRQMVQDNLGAADDKHIDLTLTLPPKVPKIQGDKQRLSILLTNLIGNAVKYTPENGAVQVSLEVRADRVAIAVRDTGIGIAPDDQAHVFDKFYRASNDAVQKITGTGLGLAIAREVARLHGGDILLESELGQGSTFTVELPLAATADYGEVVAK
jgi:two-component system phosphate regulon sensor histidine kinase PhoR